MDLNRVERRRDRAAPWVLALLLAAAVPSVLADILHLTNGNQIEGQILEKTDAGYRVRTSFGTLVVPADTVKSIEEKPTPFAEYDRRLAAAKDTAKEQTDLGVWCGENGLPAQEKKHLNRAIELDPEYEPARTALGFVKVNGVWVDGRTAVRDPEREKEAESKPAKPGDGDRQVAAIQGKWTRQIRAIRQTLLDAKSEKLNDEGRRRILDIKDPLAVLPLAKVLGDGTLAARQVLVEALGRFQTDESTLNLTVIALVEPDESLRRDAVTQLVRREDPRVVAQLRKALQSNSDALIRNAAVALGRLKAMTAVPELIDSLKVQRRKLTEVTVRRYFGAMESDFGRDTTVTLPRGNRVRYVPTIGLGAAGAFVSSETEMQMQDVTVFRTEVQQALVAITGENFGFEEAAWRRWYQERKP